MKKIIWFALLLAFLVPACGPTSSLTHTWKAQNITPKNYNKIVVLALMRDLGFKEQMEQHIVGDLTSMGYTAVCSCNEYDPKAFQGMTESEAIAKLKNGGVDAVLTIVMLDKQKERYYVPSHVYYTPYYVSHNRFWLYYHNMYDRVSTQGYFVTNTKYFWESNLYDLDADKLIYSAQSTSFDPSSAAGLGHEYGQMIVKNMVKNNVIGEQKKGF